jgi:nitrogen fixation protein FixH
MSCCGVFIMPHDATEHVTIPAREARPITGRFVLITFIAFFGVIAAVNAVMMTLAIRTMPGLDVTNGYVASQAMNSEIAAMRQQAERGWKADVSVVLRNGHASVGTHLKGQHGEPITGLAVTARLAHPALARADHHADLIEISPGSYRAEFSDIQPGAWTIVMEASRRGERVFASRNRVVLKDVQQ